MYRLITAPIIAMIALHHHARPEYPKLAPADKRKPETVGPKALEMLAVDAATPLIVPNIKSDGAEFVNKIALLGYVMVEKVHFQMTTAYKPIILRFSGSKTK